jgi:hypothetical protein
MSRETAISAVTSVLQRFLQQRLQDFDSGTTVSTKPPDKARGSGTGSQLNLFLYQTVISAALRNADPPRQVRPGEAGFPALPLELHYLVTAYGAGEDDVDAHKVLGRALSVLHDMPLFPRNDPEAVSAGLNEQIENVRLTPQTLTVEEISKLWTSFQTQYRVSSAFSVGLVFIDSTRPPRSPLPVLRRGGDDRGVNTVTSGLPLLTGVALPVGRAAAELGDTLTLLGTNLEQEGLVVEFRTERIPGVVELATVPGDAPGTLRVTLPAFHPVEAPDAFDAWVAGTYSVSLLVRRTGLPSWESNQLALSVAPRITIAPDATVASVSPGDALTVECIPHVRPEQVVLLIIGDRQIAPSGTTPPAAPADPSVLTFEVPALPVGTYPVRLRIDGADSSPIRLPAPPAPPIPEFDPLQSVRVT